ncbi:MAG: hypothetical protein HRU26_17550, partial [Psychroserpens sp.]|nr:hypothetical protein [Psychroserpens sp.]
MKKLVCLFLMCVPILNFGQASELVYLRLNLSGSGGSYNTEVFFNDNASTGFDLGFDAQFIFEVPAFALYSTFADGSTTDPLVLQAVNTLDLANITIPLGVSSSANQEITFNITINQLPPTTEVYLDDLVANTSTLLTSSSYSVTPTTAPNGIGRFFLRIVDETLITEYTFDGTWSPENPNGIATSADALIIESGNAIINQNTDCNTVVVRPGAGLTVNGGTTLDTSGGLLLESSSTSYASLILNGVVNGN